MGSRIGHANKKIKLISPLFIVYVDMGLSSNNPVTLTVVTSGASFARSFSIKVCQIECTSLSRGKILFGIQSNLCTTTFLEIPK
jgi:hypothetical protein